MALDVGKIFFDDRDIIAYSSLGIGRLIYQLPIPLCKMFIQEIFDGRNPEEFDEETLTTIQKFFENSLNVSETSRQLFIHRNTLVYRLEKLFKSTGLDLRNFDDAIKQGETGVVEREGSFEVDFDGAANVNQGAQAYWNATTKKVTTTSTDNTAIGYFAVAALSGDTRCRIILA